MLQAGATESGVAPGLGFLVSATSASSSFLQVGTRADFSQSFAQGSKLRFWVRNDLKLRVMSEVVGAYVCTHEVDSSTLCGGVAFDHSY